VTRGGNRNERPSDQSGVTPESESRLLVALVPTVLLLLAACGSGSDSDLSEAGERGRTVSNSNGCASCHGTNGQGGAGPDWIGLAGSEVSLEDGRLVVADDDYLRRAILDPNAELVAGYSLKMPENSLGDDEVDDVIASIHDLAPADGTTDE
jgi:mono/diheme cytochrome c family protein